MLNTPNTKIVVPMEMLLGLSGAARKSAYNKIYSAVWNRLPENKAKIAAISSIQKKIDWRRKYYQQNKKAICEKVSLYANKNRTAVRKRHKLWRDKNKHKIRLYSQRYQKIRKRNRIKDSCRARLAYAFKSAIVKKPRKTLELIGCTWEVLRDHMEKQFKVGMTWENYGLYGWHVDHIKPLSKFDLNDPNQVVAACHYTNLQPLWAAENLSKGARFNN